MTFPSRAHVLLWSALSGILWTLAWPGTGGLHVLAFVAWLPMLHAEQLHDARSRGHGRAFAPYAMLGLFLWNASTTWWLGAVQEPWSTRLLSGGFPMVGNTLLMALPWVVRRFVKLSLGVHSGDLAFLASWLAFERLHHDWDLQWPWLTLGNVFAEHPSWVQWYEITGVLGGSLWVLGVNLLAFRVLWRCRSSSDQRPRKSAIAALLLVLILPLGSSLVRHYTFAERGIPFEVVVVQPNIDPYHEKFGGVDALEQLDRMLVQAQAVMSDSTRLIVLPETALQENATVSGAAGGVLRLHGLWENDLEASRSVQRIRAFLADKPKVSLLAGMSSAYLFPPGASLTPTARRLGGTDRYYEAYNAALMVQADRPVDVYHKSKLVAGVEKLPFEGLLGSLDYLSIDMGGTTGSLGVQQERSVMRTADEGIAVAPVICYESVFGDHVAPHVQNGASLIAIMTNDGWWGQSPGYRQHLAYGRLRAIENRRDIARSANTGISCFIDQLGGVHQATHWWEPSAIKRTVRCADQLTFYTLYGDLVGRASLVVLSVLLVLVLARRLWWLKRQRDASAAPLPGRE